MVQAKTEMMKPRVEPMKPETQNVRLRDPRLARQMQFQNSNQRGFPQRNRVPQLAPGGQRFTTTPSATFASNVQLDNCLENRPNISPFTAVNADDSARQSRQNKSRTSSKDVKNRATTKTSPKSSQKSSNHSKSQTTKSLSTPSKSSSKSSKSSTKTNSPNSHRSPSKELRKDRHKEKESSKVSPSRSAALLALAEAEKKIKEFTIPKKRSPSPKDKLVKSITDPKVSSTTKTAGSPVKFKSGKTNLKSRNYMRRNRDESESPVPSKDIGEIGTQKMPPSPPSMPSTTTTSELTGSPKPPIVEAEPSSVSVPFDAGVGDSQSFKSKDTKFVVRLVKISHIVHSLLTRLIISNGLINDCINHRDDFLNKLIVIGTGDNFFIKTFLPFFIFQFKKQIFSLKLRFYKISRFFFIFTKIHSVFVLFERP